MDAIVPVVLAGGTGSRLWPISRSSYPKQLLNILSDNSLLQETLIRCKKLSSADPILIYNEEYHFQVLEQIKHVGMTARLILEPVPKNTAPAIALAAIEAQSLGDDPLLFILPADHYLQFEDNKNFAEKLIVAASLANKGKLVTFGIVPTYPETGYGYIKMGDVLSKNHAFSVDAFIEKPAKDLAESYCHDKRYLWNSGIFFFRASAYLNELAKHRPDILSACMQSHKDRKITSDGIYIGPSFAACPAISIDYAVMELTTAAAIIPLHAVWSDIGSWSAIFDLQPKNAEGNVIEGDVITEKSSNCYIKSSHRLVATVGLEDHIVVETQDSVLVAHKNAVQDIKKIVEHLKDKNREEIALHYYVHRPWGFYELLIDSPTYKVKRLTVNVGSSLSLQRHKHRSEHWIVVSGVATVINGDEHLVLYPSQSTYVPQGAKHRLSNFSDSPLELIEVQTGDYLGEDDIERFEDMYGRSEAVAGV